MRQKPEVVWLEFVSIPQSLFEQMQEVMLRGDVMFVNGIPFFVMLLRNIKLQGRVFA